MVEPSKNSIQGGVHFMVKDTLAMKNGPSTTKIDYGKHTFPITCEHLHIHGHKMVGNIHAYALFKMTILKLHFSTANDYHHLMSSPRGLYA
jgi:hypothetical protein